MQCDFCSRKAIIHIEELINDQKRMAHLCNDCAAKKEINLQENEFSLGEILYNLSQAGKKISYSSTSKTEFQCPNCGLSQSALQEHGLFGCEQCYDVFRTILEEILPTMHVGKIHVGKGLPTAIQNQMKPKIPLSQRIMRLKQQLNVAIDSEDFEHAAELRDQIRILNSTIQKKHRSHDEQKKE